MRPRDQVTARAYASIANVGYGFDVFGMALDIAWDDVTVALGGAGLEVSVEGERGAGIPADPATNTATRAVRAVLQAQRLRMPVRVTVRKGTPKGSGLGSSAASAAAAVVAADGLFDLGLQRPELTLYAAEGERASAGTAHTDNVAATIYGGFVIFSNEIPPRVAEVQAPPTMRVVIALPEAQLKTSTKAARGLLPPAISVAEYSRGCARTAMTALALARGDLAEFGRLIEGAWFEQARAGFVPGFAEVCDAARAAGAYGVVMSGAGPSVAAFADTASDVTAIELAMRDAFRAAGIKAATMVSGVAPGAHVVAQSSTAGQDARGTSETSGTTA